MPSKNLVGQTFKFKGINEQEFTLSALTLEDWSNFVYWIQYKPYRQASAADLPKDVLDEILKECQKGKVTEESDEGVFEEFDINFSSSVVQGALSTQEGSFNLTLVSLNKVHKLETLSEVFSISPDENPELTITNAYNKVLELSGIINSDEEDVKIEENPTNPNSTST